MSHKNRQYQLNVLKLIRQAIADGHTDIMVQGATGSGKSVVISAIMEMAYEKGKTVLFTVHRKKLLYQIKTRMEQKNIPHGMIKAGEVHEDHHPVQLASIQTLFRRLDNPYIYPADIVINDEAHRSMATTHIKALKKFQKRILIGFSATPTRKTGLGLGNVYTKLIQGKEYGAAIPDLIAQGYLVPVRYYTPIVPDLSGVDIVAGEYNMGQLSSRMMGRKIIGDIVSNWFRYGENRKTMFFGTSVKHSIAVRDAFIKAGITAEHVDGKTPDDEATAILERFASGITQVLCNCEIYTEGVDIPEIGCVIMGCPTKSIVKYLQVVGRGMRPFTFADGTLKKDCILLDHAGCVYEHGMVHEITDWDLDTSKRVVSKANEKRKAKNSKPISCPKCNNLYTGQLKCPMCGNIPVRAQFGKDVEYIDGKLGELCMVSKKVKAKEFTTEEKKRWYAELKHYAWTKGKGEKWVDGMYRAKFNVWPASHFKNVKAVPCGLEVSNHIKARNIRYAKSKQRGARP